MNDVVKIQTNKAKPEVLITYEGEQFKFKHNLPPDLLAAFLLDAASAIIKQQNADKSGQPLIWKPTGMNINAV